ncbi:hypothetical protein C8Q77DRAFT_449709 [Trametes polyzona]|nr:hypothetical protein C8Q77DRAFT_449709 [Trametes polyzona]
MRIGGELPGEGVRVKERVDLGLLLLAYRMYHYACCNDALTFCSARASGFFRSRFGPDRYFCAGWSAPAREVRRPAVVGCVVFQCSLRITTGIHRHSYCQSTRLRRLDRCSWRSDAHKSARVQCVGSPPAEEAHLHHPSSHYLRRAPSGCQNVNSVATLSSAASALRLPSPYSPGRTMASTASAGEYETYKTPRADGGIAVSQFLPCCIWTFSPPLLSPQICLLCRPPLVRTWILLHSRCAARRRCWA